MLKIPSSLPPPHPPSLVILRHRLVCRMGGICYVRSRTPASEISGQRTGGKSTDLSLCLFNLTRQAALGDFPVYFQIDHL